jgi:uncharacterized phage protein (TIGR02220 family)
MEIIEFINDLRKMGIIYYKVWLPIILQFHKKENVIIKLNTPIDIPKSTYYRVINYGIAVFPNYIKRYSLNKNHSGLILSINEQNHIQDVPIKSQQLSSAKVVLNEVVEVEIIESKAVVDKVKTPRKKSSETSYPNEVYDEIIGYLNYATGKNYKTNSVINRKFINQRMNDGFSVDDFKQVISIKSQNWLGGKMEQFLRPETLFSNKFESYLNEKVVNNSPNSNLKNAYDQVTIATELINNQE